MNASQLIVSYFTRLKEMDKFSFVQISWTVRQTGNCARQSQSLNRILPSFANTLTGTLWQIHQMTRYTTLKASLALMWTKITTRQKSPFRLRTRSGPIQFSLQAAMCTLSSSTQVKKRDLKWIAPNKRPKSAKLTSKSTDYQSSYVSLWLVCPS